MRPFVKKLADAVAVVAIKLERILRPNSELVPGNVKSVLVFQCTVPLGNCVHITPLYEAIKRERPEIIVTVATWGIGAAVLRHSPYVDHLIAMPDPRKNFFGALTSLRRQLKERGLRPDCCLTGAADMNSKIAVLAALACSGWRGGLTLLPALYARPLNYDKSLSVIANNLRLAKLIGIEVEPPEPKLFFSRDDVTVAQQLLEPARVDGRPVLAVIARGSGGLPTAWHDDRWAATIRFAHDVLGYNIVYVGVAADAISLESLKAEAGGIGISLAGATSISQLAAVLALCDMVISIDTGGFHVTRAVGTPVILLGLAWEKPLTWLVEGRPTIRILRGPELEKAPPGYRLDDISVEWVTRELADMTQHFPLDAETREARLQTNLSKIDHLRK